MKQTNVEKLKNKLIELHQENGFAAVGKHVLNLIRIAELESALKEMDLFEKIAGQNLYLMNRTKEIKSELTNIKQG